MKLFQSLDTKITDLSLLGASGLAGVFGYIIEVHGAFLVMFFSAILLGIIRWNQAMQTMKHADELHKLKIEALKADLIKKQIENDSSTSE